MPSPTACSTPSSAAPCVTAGVKVYAGKVVGYTPTGEDITVNVCKTKHLTNTRASGS